MSSTLYEKNEEKSSYFLCSKREIPKLLIMAEKEKQDILHGSDGFDKFAKGDIDISIYPKEHVMGWSIACDLTVNGETCKQYDPVGLCFLDLNEIMLKMLLQNRKVREVV
ncbi:MAG: hypothetical protein BWY46_01419 [Firmicutes bacterium ADurb.Bin300]|nr:MAG: hypothetical protein BWY46_01419 [Firmicutes bacterium ADurb.Bin300]